MSAETGHHLFKVQQGREKKTLAVVFAFRPNSFVIITANRVIHCNTDTPEEMHHWIGLLQKSKGDTRVDGQEFLVRGKLTHPAVFFFFFTSISFF